MRGAAGSAGWRENPGLGETPGDPDSSFPMRLEASPLPALDLSFSICHTSGLGQVFCSVLLNSRTAVPPRRLESGPLCLGSTHSSGAQLLAVE